MADGSLVPQATRRSPDRPARRGLILVVALLALVAAGCGAKVDQAAATRIATEFLTQGDPSGTTVRNVTVRSVQELDDAWQITIEGQVVVPGPNGGTGTSTSVHEVVQVDKQSGTATIAAQGRVGTAQAVA
jgi:hypothetical protein